MGVRGVRAAPGDTSLLGCHPCLRPVRVYRAASERQGHRELRAADACVCVRGGGACAETRPAVLLLHTWMTSVFMVCFLLCFGYGHAAALCMLTEYTMYVEKEECAFCIAVNTTVCSGYCLTKDPNMKGSLPEINLNQNICTYRDYIHKTVSVPGCPVHVNSLYTYPVALSCRCDKCNTDYIDCVQDRIESNYCTKPRLPQDFLKHFGKNVIKQKIK